jgi:two-component system chemotaxis response regulator CheB
MNGHDIIVIGGSAGALRPLEKILASLPANLPATVFVCLHVAPYAGTGTLDRLCTVTAMRATVASDGSPFGSGEVLFAPPDHHLVVKPGHVRVVRTPRENLWRPSIDVLFRSAAIAFGPRVIGTILSGALDDGSAGLLAVKRCGGLAVVQSPGDAEAGSMPESAIHNVAVDHVLDAGSIAPALERLTSEVPSPMGSTPEDLVLEARFAETGLTSAPVNQELGHLSEFTCSECEGPLWERHDQMLRYRCLTGHALTARSLEEGLNRNLDEALWAAIRQFEQRANLCSRMAADERAHGRARTATNYEERAAEARGHAETLRAILRDATRPPAATTPAPFHQGELSANT